MSVKINLTPDFCKSQYFPFLSSVTATKRLWSRLSASPWTLRRTDRHFNDQTDWLLGNITGRRNILWLSVVQTAGLIFQSVQNQITCSLSLVSLHFSTAWICKDMKCFGAALIHHLAWTMLRYLLMDGKTFSICLHLPQNSDEYKTRSKQQRWRSLSRCLAVSLRWITNWFYWRENPVCEVTHHLAEWFYVGSKDHIIQTP